MAGLMSGPGLEASRPSPESRSSAPTGAQTTPVDDRVPDDADGPEEPTPEEQAQYDEFVKGALMLVADQGESILDLLDEDPSDLKGILGDAVPLDEMTPALALAATTVIVVLEAVRRAGEKPSDDVLLQGGKEVLESIAELGEKAGEQEYSQDQLNQAWLMGLDLYREAATAEGLIDNDALKAQFDEIVTADKAGRLGQAVPGLDKAQVSEPAEEAAEEEPAAPPQSGGLVNGGVR